MSRYEAWAATRAAGISPTARVLLAHYIEAAWFDETRRPASSKAPRAVSYWSLPALSKTLDISVSSLQRANRALEEAGYISITTRYREHNHGGGRASNSVTVHLEAVLEAQGNTTSSTATNHQPSEQQQPEQGPGQRAESYPHPPVKMTSNPLVKMTSSPLVKMTGQNISNKELSKERKERAAAKQSTAPATSTGQPPATTGPAKPAPAHNTPALATLIDRAAELTTNLAAQPPTARDLSDWARLLQALTALHGPNLPLALGPGSVPPSAVAMGTARRWVLSLGPATGHTSTLAPVKTPSTSSSAPEHPQSQRAPKTQPATTARALGPASGHQRPRSATTSPSPVTAPSPSEPATEPTSTGPARTLAPLPTSERLATSQTLAPATEPTNTPAADKPLPSEPEHLPATPALAKTPSTSSSAPALPCPQPPTSTSTRPATETNRTPAPAPAPPAAPALASPTQPPAPTATATDTQPTAPRSPAPSHPKTTTTPQTHPLGQPKTPHHSPKTCPLTRSPPTQATSTRPKQPKPSEARPAPAREKDPHHAHTRRPWHLLQLPPHPQPLRPPPYRLPRGREMGRLV